MSGRTIKIVLAYEGSQFVGWQRQADGPSIQGLVEDALAAIEGSPVAVVGAGRTDAGVHALGQVASARLTSDLDPASIRRALNARLPGTVRALAVSDVPDGFNARFDATSKTYRYLIVNGETCSPFDHGRVWHVRHPLDADAVRAAAAIVEGRHDFSAFQSARAPVTSPIRRVFRSELLVEDNACDRIHAPAARLLTYEIAGSGFLRHMVRVIVGTLVDIGQGRWPPDAVSAILSSRDRTRAGRTAPAEGLYLVQVDYGRSDEREQGEGDEEA